MPVYILVAPILIQHPAYAQESKGGWLKAFRSYTLYEGDPDEPPASRFWISSAEADVVISKWDSKEMKYISFCISCPQQI